MFNATLSSNYDNYDIFLILELIWLACMQWIIMLLILTVLEFNTFQNKFKKVVCNKNVITNIFRIKAYPSIMCGYFCIGFTDFLLVYKNLTDLTNIFLANNFKKSWNNFKLF